MSVKAVVFDLDDTLYPEIDYVMSGFREVGKEIERRFGVKNVYKRLCNYFFVDKADVYGRVLRYYKVSFDKRDVDDLIEIYRTHKPKLELSSEVKETLSALKKKDLKLGIITDGRPFQQYVKIEALGLNKLVDAYLVSDEFGGIEYRKPNPISFEKMCDLLNVYPYEMIYVGDNPKKDFAIKQYLPIKTIRLCTGIYQEESYFNNILPDIVIDSLCEIINLDLNAIQGN